MLMMGCPIFSVKWNKSGSHILVTGDVSRLDVIIIKEIVDLGNF